MIGGYPAGLREETSFRFLLNVIGVRQKHELSKGKEYDHFLTFSSRE